MTPKRLFALQIPTALHFSLQCMDAAKAKVFLQDKTPPELQKLLYISYLYTHMGCTVQTCKLQNL